MTSTPTADKAGRRRDPEKDAQILQATLDLLAETDYADVTIELVAAQAGREGTPSIAAGKARTS